MLLIGIDTATQAAAAALWRDGRVLAERQRTVTTHSEMLLTMVDECCAEAGVSPRQLDGVVCGAGPGSFTGLRIGLATAKGLCFALAKPLALVSSLAAMAARAPDGRVLATLDAYKGEVYAGIFDVAAGTPTAVGGEMVLSPERLLQQLGTPPPAFLLGSGVAKYPALLAAGMQLDCEPGPRPADLLRLGAARLERGDHDDLATAAPAYIRPSEAELVKQRRPL
jgi:tRNA threonylcarbamoyladenosine biosynthesis protein TsaB